MEAATQHRPAEFTEEQKEAESRTMQPTKVTRCWCGWETTAFDGLGMVGYSKDLSIAKLAHRLDHMEGRIEDGD